MFTSVAQVVAFLLPRPESFSLKVSLKIISILGSL